MDGEYLLDLALAITIGVAAGTILCVIALIGLIVPPLGISMFVGGTLGYIVYAKPAWVNKFWKQKEYRE